MELFCSGDLDALFLVTNAPGKSAFNRVERRMAQLSHELAGVVLPQETFGTHLNSKGETIDLEHEQNNFAQAGKILAEIWLMSSSIYQLFRIYRGMKNGCVKVSTVVKLWNVGRKYVVQVSVLQFWKFCQIDSYHPLSRWRRLTLG